MKLSFLLLRHRDGSVKIATPFYCRLWSGSLSTDVTVPAAFREEYSGFCQCKTFDWKANLMHKEFFVCEIPLGKRVAKIYRPILPEFFVKLVDHIECMR